jgi:putative transposase
MRIERHHPRIPLARQCKLLGLSRSTLYYASEADPALNEALMRVIDRQYTARPFFGVGLMTAWLGRQGYAVNAKRVRRLMRLMGLEAIYPKPRLSRPDKAHRVYPYLLKDVTIDRPDQVWCTDITYLPLRRGWLYLVAIMDWFSRCVLSWELSTTLDASFCVSALERALASGGSGGPLRGPEIFNSDQGSQFTSTAFTSVLSAAGIRISMDGAGRVYDNIFIERLWRTVKYEEVYLKDYQTPPDAHAGLASYLTFYNDERPHRSLDGRTPAEVYGIRRGEPDDAASMAATPVTLRVPSVAAIEGMRTMNPP